MTSINDVKTPLPKLHRVGYIIGIVLTILLAIATLTDGGFISAIAFALLGIGILFRINPKLRTLLPILNTKSIRIGLFSILALIGLFTIPLNKSTSVNNAENIRNKEFDENEIKENVTTYINNNKGMPVLQNMDSLMVIHSLYNAGYFKAWDFQGGVLALDEKTRTAIYQPFKIETLNTKPYLKPIDKFGTLTNYAIKFKLDGRNKVVGVEGVATFSNNSQIWNDNTSLTPYLLEKEIANQKIIAIEERQVVEEKQKRKIQDEKFKEHCMNSWDGSCSALVDYVKKNMEDPESFEHIETGFWNMGTHTVVLMKYRGKNSFGGKVINSIKVEVSWNCEVIKIIGTYQ